MVLDTAHSVIEQHCQNRVFYTPSQCETNIQQAFKSEVCNLTVLTQL